MILAFEARFMKNKNMQVKNILKIGKLFLHTTLKFNKLFLYITLNSFYLL